MKLVVQRVKETRLEVDGQLISEIKKGLAIYVGVAAGDTEKDVDYFAEKVVKLRIFEDENGKMNINPADAGAKLLIVSQFTLYADCSSRRPGFTDAARPEISKPLYELVVSECKKRGFEVGTGEFGADMKVESVNDGPVTIILDL